MKPVTEKVKAYKIRVTSEVAAYTKCKPVVALRMPLIFTPLTRLFLVEWNGGWGGRADLCTVIGTDRDLLVLSRRFCWSQGKFDDDLSHLGIVLDPDVFPMLTRDSIPT